jgi:hypothetical protein
MAIEGDLNYMGIATLIQAMCLEKRKAALFLRRSTEEGVLFFDEGEIVHATLGLLIGEDAVHQLVTWKEGSFRLKDYDDLPRRSVSPGWNRHLLEGLRRMDERDSEGSPAPETSLSAADQQDDQRLEDALIVLFGRLEQVAAGAGDGRRSSRSGQPAAVLETMIPALGGAIQPLAISQTVRIELVMLLSELYATVPKVPAATSGVQREALLATVRTAMRRYFTMVTGQFHSNSAADRWRETGEVFLEDLFGKIRPVDAP